MSSPNDIMLGKLIENLEDFKPVWALILFYFSKSASLRHFVTQFKNVFLLISGFLRSDCLGNNSELFVYVILAALHCDCLYDSV